ncbi:MAG: hypothetical protein JWN06_4005 [Propionibacteriaceae bacterium]|jgi:CBS-domain-containing membrane protein|nr:hypothetical protein [Propionibacteriaceae bacterium]
MTYPVIEKINLYERGVHPPSCAISNTVLVVAAALFAGAFVGLPVAGSIRVAISLPVVCGFGWACTVMVR